MNTYVCFRLKRSHRLRQPAVRDRDDQGRPGEVYTYYGERQILFCLFRHSLPVLCKRVEEGRDVVFATVERASSLLCVVVY